MIIKASEELDEKLAEAKKSGNLVGLNATEDEAVIRETFEKGKGTDVLTRRDADSGFTPTTILRSEWREALLQRDGLPPR